MDSSSAMPPMAMNTPDEMWTNAQLKSRWSKAIIKLTGVELPVGLPLAIRGDKLSALKTAMQQCLRSQPEGIRISAWLKWYTFSTFSAEMAPSNEKNTLGPVEWQIGFVCHPDGPYVVFGLYLQLLAIHTPLVSVHPSVTWQLFQACFGADGQLARKMCVNTTSSKRRTALSVVHADFEHARANEHVLQVAFSEPEAPLVFFYFHLSSESTVTITHDGAERPRVQVSRRRSSVGSPSSPSSRASMASGSAHRQSTRGTKRSASVSLESVSDSERSEQFAERLLPGSPFSFQFVETAPSTPSLPPLSSPLSSPSSFLRNDY